MLSVFVAWLLVGGTGSPDGEESIFEIREIDRQVGVGYGVDTADMDGDGRLDIVLIDRDRVSWYRNPDWTRHDLAGALTERDHVCVAATDLTGDGKAEVIAGGQWSPADTVGSGSVHFVAPVPVALHAEPTVHRMRWLDDGAGGKSLIVAPLHGRGSRGGVGPGVRLLEYVPAKLAAHSELADPRRWALHEVDRSLHWTHNLDPVQWDEDPAEEFLLCSREGLFLFDRDSPRDGHVARTWQRTALVTEVDGQPYPGASEVRLGDLGGGRRALAAIEPFHGSQLVVYEIGGGRSVLCDDLRQGHALACADLLQLGRDQVLVGWRNRNAAGQVGVRLAIPSAGQPTKWTLKTIDDGIACEDLRVADFDGDGKLDFVAAGRATRNLRVYFNRSTLD